MMITTDGVQSGARGCLTQGCQFRLSGNDSLFTFLLSFRVPVNQVEILLYSFLTVCLLLQHSAGQELNVLIFFMGIVIKYLHLYLQIAYISHIKQNRLHTFGMKTGAIETHFTAPHLPPAAERFPVGPPKRK